MKIKNCLVWQRAGWRGKCASADSLQLKVSAAQRKKWPRFKIPAHSSHTDMQNVLVLHSMRTQRSATWPCLDPPFPFFSPHRYVGISGLIPPWNVRCVFKMMHLILKSTSQEDPVQDRWLPGEPRSSFHARICARLSPSADRDARWCALDSLWSCDLTFLKDISGKRRRRLREPHIMCRTCDPGWRPLHLIRARLIKPPGGDDELRHQQDLSLFFIIIIFWMDYFPIPTLLYLQIT